MRVSRHEKKKLTACLKMVFLTLGNKIIDENMVALLKQLGKKLTNST